MNLVLRMFDPSCGLLSKKNELKWSHIATSILPNLTEAGVTAKSEEYVRRLVAIATELDELNGNENDYTEDAGESTEVNT